MKRGLLGLFILAAALCGRFIAGAINELVGWP